jgi:homoserine dehydrogenase
MAEKNMAFNKALAEAKKQGYAEADSSEDIAGIDSANKLAILARLAFKAGVSLKDIYIEGIEDIDIQDIEYAREMGYCLKLLAVAKEDRDKLELRVHPTLVPEKHLLSSVGGAYNACYVNGDAVGEMMFYGLGAGALPAASAVLSDVIEAARSLLLPENKVVKEYVNKISIKPMKDLYAKYYVRFTTVDRPGVLSKISSILASNSFGSKSHSYYNDYS